MFVTQFIVIKWHCEIPAFLVVEKHSASIATTHASAIVHVSYQCEFVPVLSIDPGKLLLRTRTKTMVKLEFGAMARR